MNTPVTGEIRPKTTQHPEAVHDLFQELFDFDAERQAVTATGIPALMRLAEIAERDTGQAATVRRFLLGLYNGYRFPFNLVQLRGLDKALFADCMAVLTLDAKATVQEVHCYLDDGDALFERWAQSLPREASTPNQPATAYLMPSVGGVKDRPKTMTLAGYSKRQSELMGLTPMALDRVLLIQRIAQGGDTGLFLADAFLSAYRKNYPFKHALSELVNLDAEGFRLFHQILHIRHVQGLNDEALYRIEQQIICILREQPTQTLNMENDHV